MNYYGTDEYYNQMKYLDNSIFSKIVFDEPEKVRELENGYCVKYYYYADEENCRPGYAPLDGQICRLFHNEELVFEWKNTDGKSRVADMIHHTDGQDYFIFDENLYGYSVLRLSDLASVHYIPAESCGNYTGKFEETFIWFNCYYNPENNMLAVNGCIWSAPSSVIVLDFSDPMRIVEAKEWSDVYISCMDDYYDLDDIDFVRWQGSKLICKAKGAKPAAFVLDGKVEVDFE